jgi:1-acyl-sn-glycerol-3-phosphate acyltransferase
MVTEQPPEKMPATDPTVDQPAASQSSPADAAIVPRRRTRRVATASETDARGRDRSLAAFIWYRSIQYLLAFVGWIYLGWKATGRENVPQAGAALLVSNHLSYLDVVFLGIPLERPLNYVARSTLFVPVLGPLIRSLGAFPIQRDGMGASGMKETLRRLRAGGIVTLFPEGTRSDDGELQPMKPGIAVLVTRASVPVIPAGIAGTFESLPRTGRFPRPHPLHIHYGPPIEPRELDGMTPAQVTELIGERIKDCCNEARARLKSRMTRR